jgi:hypothetical protein
MKPRSGFPLPRLGTDTLFAAAGAAGFAPACAFETSQEWHALAVLGWKERRKREAMRLLPSPIAMMLALVFVVM